jgi:hypothetical protein
VPPAGFSPERGVDCERLVDGCEDVPLALADVLVEPGECVGYVHFPTRGFITLLTPVDGSTHVEVGLVGDEGMEGMPLALGFPISPLRAVVQGEGRSLRMEASAFWQALERSLARWLLMTQDRAHARTFHITHELLAMMRGVRRAGVTRAATSLQDRGLIRYRRGEVEVLDRPRLRSAACTCYDTDRRTYREVLGQ